MLFHCCQRVGWWFSGLKGGLVVKLAQKVTGAVARAEVYFPSRLPLRN
jgi:hypothetical protein